MADSDSTEQGTMIEAPVEGETRIGRVWVAPTVLAQIVARTTLGVPGVAGMCSRHPRFDRLRNATFGDATSGVHVHVADNTVDADIAIIARADANILELGRQIQSDVSDALQRMVGMTAGAINVYVDDVRGNSATPAAARRGPAQD